MIHVRPLEARHRPVLAAVLAVAFVGLAGCDLMMTDFSTKATDEWSRSYTLAPGGRIDVSNVNGRIEVLPSTGSSFEVRAEKIGKGATEEAAKAALGRIEIAEEASDTEVRLQTQTNGSGFNLGGIEVRYYLFDQRKIGEEPIELTHDLVLPSGRRAAAVRDSRGR